MMRQRTKARHIALQFLYQVDLRGHEVLSQMSTFIMENAENGVIREYARQLISGCVEHWQDIEDKIVQVAKNWTIARMAVVDRTILRIAIYELCYNREVPPKVAINEAVEMGKNFSTEHSGAFINGILDNLIPEGEKTDQV